MAPFLSKTSSYEANPIFSDCSFATDSIQDEDKLEAIAIVGFSLRFPEDAVSAEAFWNMLMEKRCTTEEFPEDRLSVSGIAAFDAPFFSISAAEAEALDPQQRGLLEITYRALENAGMPIEKTHGSKTSVYTGCFTQDWQQLCFKDSEQCSNYAALGVEICMISNRISWFFNFTGANANVDSACSSSLVALDLACKDLINKDSNMSIAAGCNLIFSPDMMHVLSNMAMLSTDSRCFSFDDRANGYARGEGFGVLVLKRLTDALRDGDTIRAVIRSTGSNQDGHTPGITQPSKDAQESLIRETYEKAGLSMNSTRFFEAHGTGTALGDPIEANTLGAAFRKSRTSSDPLYIGAVKSNVGHLEGASGIASIIKTIMVLEKGVIPPNANFERLNPKIDTAGLHIEFPLNPIPWRAKGLRRASVNSFGFGGTNAHVVLDDAFHHLLYRGLIGNHCTIQNPPSSEAFGLAAKQLPFLHHDKSSKGSSSRVMRPKLMVWSAKGEQGLKSLARDYQRHFTNTFVILEERNSYLESLAYTLNARRSLFEWNSFMLVDSIDDLNQLESNLSSPQQRIKNPKLAFIFTGQGAQWAGMGSELSVFPIFQQILIEAEEYLKEIGCPWLLRIELLKEELQSNIHKPEFSQPLCTAVQIAFVDLLRSFGIYPTAVVGHSSGEIAAAYCIGAITQKAALKIAYFRGTSATLLTNSNCHDGDMISVGLSEPQARAYIDEVAKNFGSRGLAVACINSHKNVTISGDAIQIDDLKITLDKEDIFARKLNIGVAYHSHHMEAIANEYIESIRNLEKCYQPLNCARMISSVTGQIVAADDLASAEYWVRNMVSPVKFSDALEHLCVRSAGKIPKKLDRSHQNQFQIDILIEIGPHSALRRPIIEILDKLSVPSKQTYTSVSHRHQPSIRSILHAAGQLHCLGYPVNLNKANGIDKMKRPLALPSLPEYPFDHSQEYWHESRTSKRFRLSKEAKLDLLGKPVPDSNPLEAKWRNFLRVSEMPWIDDHVINGSLIYPAAGMLVMAIEAANQTAGPTREVIGFRLKDVIFRRALNIPRDANGIETHFFLRQDKDAFDSPMSWSEFRLCAFKSEQWHEHCRGSIQVEYQRNQTEVDGGKESLEQLRQCQRTDDAMANSCLNAIDTTQLYKTLGKSGFGFGQAFRPIEAGYFSYNNEARAEIKLYRWLPNNHPQLHVVHPTTLDGVLHLVLAALSQGGEKEISTLVPTGIKEMWIAKHGLSHPESKSVKAVCRMTAKDNRGVNFDIFAVDEPRNHIRVQVEDLRMVEVAGPTSRSESQEVQLCYCLDLKPDLDQLKRQQLLEYCRLAEYQAPEPVQFYQDLTFVLLMFLSKVMSSFGDTEPHDIKPHLRKYISWARMQLENFNAGTLLSSRTEWKALLHDADYIESICRSVELANDQGRVFVTVGRNLLNILRGEIDPLEFLFKSNLLRDLYREINDNRTCFPELEQYIDALAHKKPDMKILEVGAGSGGTTAKILHTLSAHTDGIQGSVRYASYCYTDISQSFFEQAKKKFQNYSRMTFSRLDIEIDPIDQDYEARSYDLIVAANVLHATVDINITMRHVRTLLRPGGKLVMYEPTNPDILRTGFVAGLLSGWWLAVEDYRLKGPSLTSRMWDKVLLDNGFSGLDLELPDFRSEACQEGSILITTAISPASKSHIRDKIVIVVDSNSSMQQKTSRHLKSLLLSENQLDCAIYGFQEAASLPDKETIIYMYLQDLEQQTFHDISSETYLILQQSLTCCKGAFWVSSAGGVVPKQPSHAILDGLFRVLRNEYPGKRFVNLALDVRGCPSEHQLHSIYCIFMDTQVKAEIAEYEPEYVEIDGFLNIPRALLDNELSKSLHTRSLAQQFKVQSINESIPLRLTIGSPGLLNSLHFIEDKDYIQPLEPDEVEIQLRAVGLNFRDCLVALGRVPGTTFGSECAGVVTRVGGECNLYPGDRVMVITNEAFKNFPREEVDHVWKIPASLSFVEAASIPAQFGTAWQAIQGIARIQKGQSILIHAGAGGTGQAAVQISQYLGAEVFVTVSSELKKKILMDEYGIPENHIFYSEDTSFAKGIKRMTKGRGVDVVLNSLAGDSLVASWECIAPYGRFIEIGKKDILSNSSLPMFSFRHNTSFSAFDGFSWLWQRPMEARATIQDVIDLYAAKKLHAARPLHVYNISDVQKALRLMHDGKTAGKIVLELTLDSMVPAIIDTKPSFSLDSNSTYLIAGGLGGLGRSIARWMVSRGARNLILLSRSGVNNETARAFLEEMKMNGARVEAPQCDITNITSLEKKLTPYTTDMPPIKGCIQGSMVLRDALFDKMSYGDWQAGTECKTLGSWNLHTLLPRGLDFFIMLSSASGAVGLRGQANYAAGNTYLDAFARYRIDHGEKAVSLDLGVMMEDGALAENVDLLNRVLAYGALDAISRSQFFAMLDYYCDPALPISTVRKGQVIIGLGIGAGSGLDGMAISRQALFCHLRQPSSAIEDVTTWDKKVVDFRRLFQQSNSLAEGGTIMSEALIQKLSNSLSALHKDVDMQKPMHAYGVDSLLAMELRNWIAKEFSADVPVFEIVGGSTLNTLGMLIASRSQVKPSSWR